MATHRCLKRFLEGFRNGSDQHSGRSRSRSLKSITIHGQWHSIEAKAGSLRAKCVVVDSEPFISSANFTEAAQERNIETGFDTRFARSGVPSHRATAAAQSTKPSWYIVAGNDRMIPLALEEAMAKKINAHTTTLRSNHVVMLSHPEAVAKVIEVAASRSLTSSATPRGGPEGGPGRLNYLRKSGGHPMSGTSSTRPPPAPRPVVTATRAAVFGLISRR